MSALAPISSTIRDVDWQELPASVRSIPSGFDPMAKGVLMAHQVEWLKLHAKIKVAEKGRRTGITFAEALDDTITAASRKSAGGSDIFYIGDTKEKGLEFIGYCAAFSKVITEAQGEGISGIEEFLFEDQDPETGKTRNISAYRIRYASGFKIVALSSNPANIRGLQGIVVIDEAAYHANVQAVLDAATALLIWGGQIRVISTHNGVNNPFNQLIKDIGDGRYGNSAKLFHATFDDAVANGLYERMCLVTSQQPTPEGKREWYTGIRGAYGPRQAAMREELDAVPREGNGTAIPGVWIEKAMRAERPVLRLVLDDDFAKRPEKEREDWCNEWIEKNLAPLVAALDKRNEHVAGMDFARHRHFSVIMPAEIDMRLMRRVPFLIEMANVPTRQQEQILWYLIPGLPKFAGCAIDATGPGQTIAEYTGDKFGEAIHQVVLSRAWYRDWMNKFTEAFQDATIDLPRDAALQSDLRAVELIDGIPMVPHVERKDLKDPELFRHGDGAIAGALMWFASLHRNLMRYDYRSAKRTAGNNKDRDNDGRLVRVTGGFRRGVM